MKPHFAVNIHAAGLKQRFLKELLISSEDIDLGFLTLPDGSEWKLYLEGDALIRYVERQYPTKIACLCSFQHWAEPEDTQIVVCRKLSPKAV